MPIAASKINPCLWFDTEAEEAAKFYCSVFKKSRMGRISRYVDEGQEIHGKEAGSVMAVDSSSTGNHSQASMAARTSSSARRFHSRSTVMTRKRSTISGRSCHKAGRRVLAAG